MLKAVRWHLTYANVMATVAVFLAFGGGAYALTGIPDGGGMYHGCVATSGALRVVTKASSCLKAKTVKRGNRRVRIPGESPIAWNQQGRPGINGTNGVNGTKGANGATDVVVRTGNQVTVNPFSTGVATVSCNPGERATGGGYEFPGGQVDPAIYESTPTGDPPTGWRIKIWKPNTGTSATLAAKVICASP
jgi:hypothetical protein